MLQKVLATTVLTTTFLIGSLAFASNPSHAATCDYHRGDLTANLDWEKGTSTVTNTTTNCTFTAGLASYKGYLPYTNDPNNLEWIYVQTYYDGTTTTVKPGQTVTLKVSLPSCAYQIDVFEGPIIKQLKPGNLYSQQGRYIDGWFTTNKPLCTKETPTPTPTKVVTPTPTKVATPTPTQSIPTPTPTAVVSTPTPTSVPPTPTPTPENHTVQELPKVVKTPDTGAETIALLGLIPSAISGFIIRRRSK